MTIPTSSSEGLIRVVGATGKTRLRVADRFADGIGEGRGREPRTFADYGRRTAATDVWRAAA